MKSRRLGARIGLADIKKGSHTYMKTEDIIEAVWEALHDHEGGFTMKTAAEAWEEFKEHYMPVEMRVSMMSTEELDDLLRELILRGEDPDEEQAELIRAIRKELRLREQA